MVNGGYKPAQALDAVHESAYAHPGFFATFVVKCVNTTGTLNVKVVIMTGGYLANVLHYKVLKNKVFTVLYAVLRKTTYTLCFCTL